MFIFDINLSPMNIFLYFWSFWCLVVTIFVFLFLFIPNLILIFCLGKFGKKFFVQYNFYVANFLLTFYGMRKKITGFFPIKFNDSCIYIINHKSYLDVIILASIIPHKIKYLGKAEVFKWPLFGYLAKHSGQISVNRESKESRNRGYDEMKKAIIEGYSIIIFPEGGWKNKDDKKSNNPYNLKEDCLLHEFRNGAFRLAVETKVPVVPITLLNAQDRFSDIDMLVRFGQIKAHIFNPIDPLEFSDSLTLNRHCNNIMLEKLQEYRNEN